MAAAQVVVIGGTVLDIQAWPEAPHDVRRGSSVPGHVSQLPGGVGRNIAEAAHHLLAAAAAHAERHQPGDRQQRESVLLVSAIGQDTAADALLASFAQHGMSTDGLIRSSRAATPCVVAVLDRHGEVAASIADVAAPSLELTPAVVQRHAPDISAAGILVLDANLDQRTLAAAVQAASAGGGGSVPVLFEPVSVPKAVRCVPVLSALHAITPNGNELLAIADEVQQAAGLPPLPHPQPAASGSGGGGTQPGLLPQQLLAQLAPAAAVVLQQGLHCIILTMGELGAAILTLKPHQQQHQQQRRPPQHQDVVLQAQHIPAQRVGSVVNLCGAGDTLVGGFAAARMRDCSPLQALAVGVCAAALSVQSKANVPGPGEGLTFDAVRAAAQPLLDQQHAWEFVVPPGLARL